MSPPKAVVDTQVRLLLEKQCADIARDLKAKLPAGVGFALVMSDFGQGGNTAYVSTQDREDTARLFLELVARWRSAEPHKHVFTPELLLTALLSLATWTTEDLERAVAKIGYVLMVAEAERDGDQPDEVSPEEREERVRDVLLRVQATFPGILPPFDLAPMPTPEPRDGEAEPG